ncbi:MAG: TPM domain-containing protein [Chitinophagaceae bacterium]|nr:TPM domain-containing protein [Chitinophagaceae bacterium]
MGIFSPFRKKSFFTHEEEEKIVQAIRNAERMTSGEVRLYVESRCRFVDPVDRAAEVFYGLKMDQTDDRNGVLVYVAMKDHQLAIYGDEGIHKKVGGDFWRTEVEKMISDFNTTDYTQGIIHIVNDIGEALHKHFPYMKDEDKNELPDNIVFGN